MIQDDDALLHAVEVLQADHESAKEQLHNVDGSLQRLATTLHALDKRAKETEGDLAALRAGLARVADPASTQHWPPIVTSLAIFVSVVITIGTLAELVIASLGLKATKDAKRAAEEAAAVYSSTSKELVTRTGDALQNIARDAQDTATKLGLKVSSARRLAHEAMDAAAKTGAIAVGVKRQVGFDADLEIANNKHRVLIYLGAALPSTAEGPLSGMLSHVGFTEQHFIRSGSAPPVHGECAIYYYSPKAWDQALCVSLLVEPLLLPAARGATTITLEPTLIDLPLREADIQVHLDGPECPIDPGAISMRTGDCPARIARWIEGSSGAD